MGLLKKEEKLLKRLFQKRKNELQSFVTNNLKTLENKESNRHLSESITLTMNRHIQEINELTRLEAKVFKEINKYEQANHPQETIRQTY
jgi:hypothetical protein